MPFRCDAATLGRLEWPRLADCLARETATPSAAERCLADPFAETRGSVLERLDETDEARRLLDAGEPLPLGGLRDLRTPLDALARGAVLPVADLVDVADTLRGAARLERFLRDRPDRAPRLAALAETLPDLDALRDALEAKLAPNGDLRDDATPALARLRRRVRELEAQIESRMATFLRDPKIAPHLQDDFSTRRDDRPVLPVRASARGAVRGLVHDVSASGTTVFVEPEAVVELGNTLRLERTQLAHEIDRILAELSAAIGERRAEIVAQSRTLERLDLASARGRLSQKVDGVRPELAEDGRIALLALRHPLLLLEAGLGFEDVVPNDLELPPDARGLLISGPNAGGKTVAAKALGLSALMLRAGLHVAGRAPSRLPLFDAIYADIGDEQDLRSGLSTFSARMANLARVLELADESSLVIVDEIGEGTEPGEGAALAQAVLEALVARGARVVATTHFNRLKELAAGDPTFTNASAEFDRETLLPTYRLRLGAPGSSGATFVAERMGVPPEVIQRARAVMDQDDRKLEALTRDLSELRQELDSERRQAGEVREQTEAARERYERRLAALHAAREDALAAMKADLEVAYRQARDEIAGVVRSLQEGRGEGGKRATAADRELGRVRERVRQVEERHEPEPEAPLPVDWSNVEAGARLQVRGLAAPASFVEGPDRRGRLTVHVGQLRTRIEADRVIALEADPAAGRPSPRRGPDQVVRKDPDDAPRECDLRGLRVDEALDRADAHLARLLGSGVGSVRFVHGHGTGALRSAIRAWLRDLPYVASFEPAPEKQGGNGVTVALLRD